MSFKKNELTVLPQEFTPEEKEQIYKNLDLDKILEDINEIKRNIEDIYFKINNLENKG